MRSMFTPIAGLSLLGLWAVAPFAMATPVPAAAQIEFVFSGFSEQKGRVFAQLVCEGRDGGKKAVPIGIALAVDAPQVTAKFPDRAAGEVCSLRAFRDTNGNQKLDTNLVGIPSEPFAFSNNAKAQLGPPKPEATRFTLKPGLNRQAITLK